MEKRAMLNTSIIAVGALNSFNQYSTGFFCTIRCSRVEFLWRTFSKLFMIKCHKICICIVFLHVWWYTKHLIIKAAKIRIAIGTHTATRKQTLVRTLNSAWRRKDGHMPGSNGNVFWKLRQDKVSWHDPTNITKAQCFSIRKQQLIKCKSFKWEMLQ